MPPTARPVALAASSALIADVVVVAGGGGGEKPPGSYTLFGRIDGVCMAAWCFSCKTGDS